MRPVKGPQIFISFSDTKFAVSDWPRVLNAGFSLVWRVTQLEPPKGTKDEVKRPLELGVVRVLVFAYFWGSLLFFFVLTCASKFRRFV